MGRLPVSIDASKCIGCGDCLTVCMFGALRLENGLAQVSENCRGCSQCVNVCRTAAIVAQKDPGKQADVSWSGILVYLQKDAAGDVLPVSVELLRKAREMAAAAGQKVFGLLIEEEIMENDKKITGPDTLFIVTGRAYRYFTERAFSQAVIQCIETCRPSVVLFGATPEGRSIAPMAAVHFQTGVTADCTSLAMDGEGKLIQTRPAFGGNLMAEIVTPYARPQMATVRPGVLYAAESAVESETAGNASSIVVLHGAGRAPEIWKNGEHPAETAGLEQAAFLVAAGAGVGSKEDMERIRRWAASVGAAFGCSRKLVEKGWAPSECQIGLSGSSVSPKLLILFGISGSVQFLAGIRQAQFVVAINNDKEAPVFGRANRGICCDLNQVLEQLEKGIGAVPR